MSIVFLATHLSSTHFIDNLLQELTSHKKVDFWWQYCSVYTEANLHTTHISCWSIFKGNYWRDNSCCPAVLNLFPGSTWWQDACSLFNPVSSQVQVQREREGETISPVAHQMPWNEASELSPEHSVLPRSAMPWVGALGPQGPQGPRVGEGSIWRQKSRSVTEKRMN